MFYQVGDLANPGTDNVPQVDLLSHVRVCALRFNLQARPVFLMPDRWDSLRLTRDFTTTPKRATRVSPIL